MLSYVFLSEYISGKIPNQARAAFYWAGNKFNGGATPPGFIANGKFYSMNPQMIPTIQATPVLPALSSNVPRTIVTNARPLQSPIVGVVSPGAQMKQCSVVVSTSGTDIRGTNVVAPNESVASQPSKEIPCSPKLPLGRSPGVKTSPRQSKSPVSSLPSPDARVPDTGKNASNENASPAKTAEESETHANNTTSPSNLVSIMKTSLRKKHSKENVQPLPNMFKMKRKLDPEKRDEPPSKKHAKPTIFTPLNEQEAEKLANDIYDVNLEYFPFQTLAVKAAQSEEIPPEPPYRSEKTDKVREIEKVR